MPFAISIGITEDEFWHMNPHRIEIRKKAYKLQKNLRDEEMWIQGMYIYNAFAVVLSNAFSKGAKLEYIDEPFSRKQAVQENQEDIVLSEEEKKRRTEALFGNLRIMQFNFEQTHNKNSEATEGDLT